MNSQFFDALSWSRSKKSSMSNKSSQINRNHFAGTFFSNTLKFRFALLCSTSNITRSSSNSLYFYTNKEISNKLIVNQTGRKTRMQTITKKPKLTSVRIALSFLISGITLFVLSVFLGSQIICVIGLGLVFWGALFLLITPQKYVESSFLISSTLPTYLNIDRMLNDLHLKNEAYNIPPYPRYMYLPEHLKGLKEMVTFIPAEHNSGVVEIEDIARGKFLIEKPKGLLLSSPGIGLLDKIEQKNQVELAKIPLSELDEKLPNLLGELFLAKEITMNTTENHIILQIHNSLYENLYSQKYNLTSIRLIGCPLVNAAACAIAKSTGKLIMIQEIKVLPNSKTTTVTFEIVSRTFEKQQKLVEDYEKVILTSKELVDVVYDSISLVDLSFDILIGLQKKRINWRLLEDYSKALGENSGFISQLMPSIKLDFSKISSAIKSNIPKETSEATYSLLKVIYSYFDTLSLDENLKEIPPNFQSAKSIILSYFTLNDILLGKAIGEKENKKEAVQLESILQILANTTEFRVNIEELMVSIDKITPDKELEINIEDTRKVFKSQLKSVSSLYSSSEINT